jgi:hypothetical protein
MFVKMLNVYLAFGGGSVIVAMFVDACRHIKSPAMQSTRSVASKSRSESCQCVAKMRIRKKVDRQLPEIDVVATE